MKWLLIPVVLFALILIFGKRIRYEVQVRLEADDERHDGWKAFAERTTYSNSERFKINITAAPTASDGERVEVLINDQQVAEVEIDMGSGRYSISDSAGRGVPEADVGDRLTVRYRGEAVLSGPFEKD